LITSRQGQGASPMLFDVVSDPSEKTIFQASIQRSFRNLLRLSRSTQKIFPRKPDGVLEAEEVVGKNGLPASRIREGVCRQGR